MTHLLRFCLILLTATSAWAQGFTITASPRARTITAGMRATFTISALPNNGFNASVPLRVIAPTLNPAIVLLDPQKINAPYSSVATLTIAPTGGDIGAHMIIIEGKNGNVVSYDTITLTVRLVAGADQWVVYDTVNSALPSMRILAIEFDRTGTTWIGTELGLLRALPGRAPERMNGPFGGRTIHAMAIDSANGVWVLNYGSISRYLNGTWVDYQLPDTLLNLRSSVHSIAATPDSSIWFGTEVGLLRLRHDEWTHFTSNDWGTAIGNQVYDIVVTSKGEVWGSSTDRAGHCGLVKFDGRFWTTYSMRELGLGEHMDIGRLAVDDSDQVWIVTWDGLSSASGPQIIHRGSPGRAVTIAAGSDGRLWLGSQLSEDGQILYAEQGQAWKEYPLDSSGLGHQARPTEIAIHDDGSIWVGTYAHGLAILRPGTGPLGIANTVHSNASSHMAVAPNPIASQGTIAVTTKGGPARLSLNDNVGRQVAILFEGALRPGEQSLPIDLSEIAAGAYLLTLSVDGGISTSRMILVAR